MRKLSSLTMVLLLITSILVGLLQNGEWFGDELPTYKTDIKSLEKHGEESFSIAKRNSNWYLQTVDSQGWVGSSGSIALDGDNNPHISYRDWTNSDLK